MPLSYPLTPHATLAYFHPGEIDRDAVKRLQSALDAEDVRDHVMHLDVGRLNACIFTDMNHYYPVRDEAAFDRLG